MIWSCLWAILILEINLFEMKKKKQQEKFFVFFSWKWFEPQREIDGLSEWRISLTFQSWQKEFKVAYYSFITVQEVYTINMKI